MNILILHTASDMYGASKILLIVSHILKRNHLNPIVVLSEDGPLVEELQKAGIEVHIIRLGILRRKYFNIPGLFNRITASVRAWKILNKLIEEKKPEIIYSNTTGVIIGAFLAKRKCIRHIWHVHEIISKPVVFTKIIGYFLNNLSDQVIVVSDAVRKHWLKTVDDQRMIKIYNGIDISPFEDRTTNIRKELNIPDQAVLIGMIGRVNHWKGQGYFLDMVEILAARYPAAYFLMAGDAFPGNEHLVTELNRNIQNSCFSSRIFNLGYRTDIINILNGLDIFVLPSIQPDPFPTVILEAMSAAKPVVATDHGGAPEMIEDGQSGILIPVGEAGIAAERISRLIEDTSARKKIGIKAEKRVMDLFSYEAFEKRILNLFKG